MNPVPVTMTVEPGDRGIPNKFQMRYRHLHGKVCPREVSFISEDEEQIVGYIVTSVTYLYSLQFPQI